MTAAENHATALDTRFAAIGWRKAAELLEFYDQMPALPPPEPSGLPPDDRAITQRQTAAKALLGHYHLLRRLLPAGAAATSGELPPPLIDAAMLDSMLQAARQHAAPADASFPTIGPPGEDSQDDG